MQPTVTFRVVLGMITFINHTLGLMMKNHIQIREPVKNVLADFVR